MKSLLLAGMLMVATGTVCIADQNFWVVGNRATGKCDIVTSNPVIYSSPAYDGGGQYTYWFGDGPYQSLDDAKLARSSINACPKDEPSSAK